MSHGPDMDKGQKELARTVGLSGGAQKYSKSEKGDHPLEIVQDDNWLNKISSATTYDGPHFA